MDLINGIWVREAKRGEGKGEKGYRGVEQSERVNRY